MGLVKPCCGFRDFDFLCFLDMLKMRTYEARKPRMPRGQRALRIGNEVSLSVSKTISRQRRRSSLLLVARNIAQVYNAMNSRGRLDLEKIYASLNTICL